MSERKPFHPLSLTRVGGFVEFLDLIIASSSSSMCRSWLKAALLRVFALPVSSPVSHLSPLRWGFARYLGSIARYGVGLLGYLLVQGRGPRARRTFGPLFGARVEQPGRARVLGGESGFGVL